MAKRTIDRSTLRKLSISQVINMANNAVDNDGMTWQRIFRMWSSLAVNGGDRKPCENELARAMGYTCIKEDVK